MKPITHNIALFFENAQTRILDDQFVMVRTGIEADAPPNSVSVIQRPPILAIFLIRKLRVFPGESNMSSGCHSECVAESPSKTHVCPVNGQEYSSVGLKTILHHINSPWKWMEKQQGYYFCDDPDCEVVYFGEDDSVITKAEVRTVVGVKESKPDALACYCFGVSNLDAQQHPAIREFIVDKTKAGFCSCDTSNPSGHCCLKTFPAKENSSH